MGGKEEGGGVGFVVEEGEVEVIDGDSGAWGGGTVDLERRVATAGR